MVGYHLHCCRGGRRRGLVEEVGDLVEMIAYFGEFVEMAGYHLHGGRRRRRRRSKEIDDIDDMIDDCRRRRGGFEERKKE